MSGIDVYQQESEGSYLGLVVVARHEVAERPECRGDHVAILVSQQFRQLLHHPRIHDRVDAIGVSIREVRQCPRCVDQHLLDMEGGVKGSLAFSPCDCSLAWGEHLLPPVTRAWTHSLAQPYTPTRAMDQG